MHFGRAQDEHGGLADLSPPQPVRRNSQIARRARTRAWGRDAGQGARASWEVSRQPTLACAFAASHQPARCAAASSRTVASGGGPQVDGGTHGGRGPVTLPVRNLDKDLIQRLCTVSPLHARELEKFCVRSVAVLSTQPKIPWSSDLWSPPCEGIGIWATYKDARLFRARRDAARPCYADRLSVLE